MQSLEDCAAVEGRCSRRRTVQRLKDGAGAVSTIYSVVGNSAFTLGSCLVFACKGSNDSSDEYRSLGLVKLFRAVAEVPPSHPSIAHGVVNKTARNQCALCPRG
jgi:hypothetical protein